MRKSLVVCSALLLITGFTACGSESSEESQSTTSVAAVENPYGGPDVPPPSPDEPILKLINGEKTLSLSLNDLRDLPQVEARVFEPFVKSEISFKGVAMDELFQLVDIEIELKVLCKSAFEVPQLLSRYLFFSPTLPPWGNRSYLTVVSGVAWVREPNVPT